MKYLQDIKDAIRFKETETYQRVISILDTEEDKKKYTEIFSNCSDACLNGLRRYVENFLLKPEEKSEQKKLLKEFIESYSPKKVSSQQVNVPDNLQNTRV